MPKWSMSSASAPSQLPTVLLFNMTPHGIGYPLAIFSVVLAVSPSARCAHPTFLLAGQHQKLKRPWLWVSTAVQLNHQCHISIIFILNPNYSIIPATRRKFNSVTGETRTPWKLKRSRLPCVESCPQNPVFQR